MNYFKRITSVLIVVVALCAGSLKARAENDGSIILRYPDDGQFSQIIDLVLAFKHDEALALAKDYLEKHGNHPCGHFAMGLVNEWMVSWQYPQPSLQPAIVEFDAAMNTPSPKRDDVEEISQQSFDATASICRGAAGIHVTRLYYKRGKMMKGIRSAMSAAHELETTVKLAPQAYDAYSYLGPYHYFTDRQPIAARFVMRLFGLKGDREQGLRELALAWSKAPHFNMSACETLYVIRSQYEGDYEEHKDILATLINRYPKNVVYQHLWERANNRLATSRQ